MTGFSAECGRLCESKAGRDKGRSFIILKALDDKHVEIADGKLRKLERPKKKKLMHLRLRPVVFEQIVGLYQSAQLKNSDVRAALAQINGPIKEETACLSKTLSK